MPVTEVTGAVPLEAAVIKPLPLTVIDALVKLPTLVLTVAKVPAAVTLAEPSKLGLVYAKSPVIEIVLPVVSVAADPVVFWLSVGMSAATTARKVGTPAEPSGAAKTKLAVLLAYGFCVSP